MKYSTVCSGIEAPTVAWHNIGWQPVWFSEIDKFPSAVLNHHYPEIPNLGDMTKIHNCEEFRKTTGSIDVFCGGTPCQSFSVAGLRKGLADPRGNLALVFLGIVDKIRPRWVVWENVPGVLSSNNGRDFGSFVGALGQLGYGWSYRVLDAQYTGVPQRRRRVFVVGYIGDWRPAGAVLFERYSLQRNPTPGKAKRATAANGIAPSLTVSGKSPGSVNQQDAENGLYQIVGALSKSSQFGDHYSHRPPLVFNGDAGAKSDIALSDKVSPTLLKGNGKSTSVLWSIMPQNSGKDYKAKPSTVEQPLMASGNVGGNQGGDYLTTNNRVRRLTPLEWERLQGFPDNYTLIKYNGRKAKDSPRYKALGNSMAVPVMQWIGNRIQLVDDCLKSLK